MLSLLLAAMRNEEKGVCRDYSISISGTENELFIDRDDVELLLKKEAGGSLKGKKLAALNLQALETELEKSKWILDAVLYVDKQDVLHVHVDEREPVARIFTAQGSSFYIDRNGERLPLSDKVSARVPVFTGVPDVKKLSYADSVLWNRITAAADYIRKDPFWMAQVAQIEITPDRQFEMIPVVGNHVVKMGDGSAIDRQFTRLLIFYKEVLRKTGFDTYKVINVQYKGQVVASRGQGSAADSVQLRKSVEELLRRSRQSATDTVTGLLPAPAIPLIPDTPDETPGREDNQRTTTDSDPVPVNTFNNKPAPGNKPAARQPKAVMPARNGNGQQNRN